MTYLDDANMQKINTYSSNSIYFSFILFLVFETDMSFHALKKICSQVGKVSSLNFFSSQVDAIP